ncbi:MAG: BclA C-terminal domain-containing protein [Parachlamydiaceae bacterium]
MFKPLIALMLLSALELSAVNFNSTADCKQPCPGPAGPSGGMGAAGPSGATGVTGATGATGIAGVNPSEVNAFAQSDFIADENRSFDPGESIPFNATTNVLNGITYTDPDFTLTTAGFYQVSFEGYISDMDDIANTGVQFFLNENPIGTPYTPVPAFVFFPPYLFVTQAIFTASAGDQLSVRAIGGAIRFDTEGGGASASINIIKLEN